MNQTIKARWVEALRSGEYKQGVGQLYRSSSNTYCCLGVLCKLYEDESGDRPVEMDFPEEMDQTLPSGVRVWADLDDENPAVTNRDGYEDALTGFNDSGDYTFSDLADLIEQQL